jgi:SecD/SecF fusion protein
MLENPRRQLFLVVLVCLFGLISAFSHKPALGLDLSGGTQLIYDVDIEAAKASGLVGKDVPNHEIMRETLGIIAERIDPTGTREMVVTQRGESGILIELPDVGETEAAILKRQIETLGRLEMRLVASADYNEGGVRFDLEGEKRRLEAWLNEGTNRALVSEHPERIDLFNHLTGDKGRIDREHLLWFPHKILPSYRDSTQWDYSYALADRGMFAVAAFDPAQYQAPPPTWEGEEKPVLVEFLPINMHAPYFSGEDMNAAGVRAGTDPQDGLPCVFYEIAAGKKNAYADWSEANKGQKSAIILNGLVRSAPVFQDRIYGHGIIHGGFTTQEAEDLAKVIKTGSLQVKPEFVSSQTIGATLGKRSIELGLWSMVFGGLLVLAFFVLYYRLAGLIAFVAHTLNVGLLFGVVQFIHATLTLPGIAGLALTLGMAVDANILIYERIREETKRGKDFLQAVRAGFDRAAITIIDANLTHLFAAIVLYNVGTGPVRGFAATLMVGIATTLFSALIVTRVLFHYLMAAKVLTKYSAAAWFTKINFSFVKHFKLVFSLSMLIVVLGLGFAATVPTDRMLGLDFTGGASLHLTLREQLTEQELRERMASDPEFNAEYPDPLVTQLGTDGKSFSVKLKLNAKQRDDLARLAAEAKAKKVPFDPPFKTEILRNEQIPLVAPAFSDVNNFALPSGSHMATANVNFGHPVKLSELVERLRATCGDVKLVTETDEVPETGTTVTIEFPVLPTTTPAEITDRISNGLKGMADVDGNPVQLSNPIPSAEIIGSRMVGELRTAAMGALILALFLIGVYIRLRFREYKYGIAAVISIVHDVLITFAVVVIANSLRLVNAEIDLAMIAAFLTVLGYSVNDTVVIFDRVRENLNDQKRLGIKETFAEMLNRSMNQTLSRTILTSLATMFVVVAVFVVNRGSGSGLEGFSFALLVGFSSGTYSTLFVACPIVLWLHRHERAREEQDVPGRANDAKVALKSSV